MKNTKSLLALFLACMMVISCFVVTPVMAEDIVDEWDGKTDTSWYNTTDKVFTLTTAEQVAGLAELVNGGNNFSGKTIKLGADIQLNDVSDFANWATTAPTYMWCPIGGYQSDKNTHAFAGTFDGQGHKVIGMYTKASSGNAVFNYARVGFFGQTNNISISNVTFENCYTQGGSSGIVVGWGNAMPSFNNVDIVDCVVKGGSSVGFLLGQSGKGTFTAKNCEVSGTISGSGKVGGLLGNHQGGTAGLDIDNCDVDVTITSTSNYAGGAVGALGYYADQAMTGVSVKNSTFKADIAGTRDVAAVVAYIKGASAPSVVFENLTVEASLKVSGSSVNFQGVAMLLGYAEVGGAITNFTVDNVNIKGDLEGGQNSGVVLGRDSGSIGTLTIKDLVSDVDVSIKKGSSNSQCVGGIVGLAQKDIGTLTVNGYTSTNTYTVDENGATQVGDILGATTTKAGTVSIFGANVDVAFTGAISKVGALLGNASVDKITISGSEIKANIDSTGTQLGGIVSGLNNGAALTIIGTNVDVTVAGAENVGGLFASSTGAIELTINGSDIKANVDGGEAAGGIANSIDSADAVINAVNSKLDITSTGKTLVATTDATLTYRNTTITPADEELLGMEIIKDTSVIDVWDNSIAENFAGGTGTAEDPYVIETGAQLAYFAQEVTANNASIIKAHVLLAANIQLNSDEDLQNYLNWSTDVAPAYSWNPIGYEGKGYFQGTFDGQGYTISGMYIDSSDGSVAGGRAALFGKGATSTVIKDLTITKSYVNSKTCAGILFANTSGFPANISNVIINECTLIGTSDGTGFIIGKSGGPGTVTISNCDVSGKMTSSYAGGGYVGYVSGTGNMTEINIINCSADIEMVGTYTDDKAIGGVIGIVGNLDTTKSGDAYKYNPKVGAINIKNTDGVERTFKITVDANRTVGGLIGQTYLASLGDITVEGVNVVVDIDTTASTANNSDIGGIIGYIRADEHTGTVTIKDTEVSGSISAGQNSAILIGRINYARTGVSNVNAIIIENVTTDVDFATAKGSSGVQQFGGVIGLAQRTINEFTVTNYNSTNKFTPSSSNGKDGTASTIGGIVGSATIITANISDCVLNDTIKGSTYIGGIFGNGTITTATVSGCNVGGTIAGNDSVGGMFGGPNLRTTTVSDSKVTATISTGVGAGGIFGWFRGETLNVINTVVESTLSGKEYVAGFVGDIGTNANTYAKCYFTFEGCAFTGSATATTRFAGGFLGDYDTKDGGSVAGTTNNCGIFTFKNCFVDATINSPIAGGLIGRIYPLNGKVVVENVVILGECTGTSVGALIGTYGEGGSNSLADLVTINNLYFNNGTTKFFGSEKGTVNYASKVFYTPAAVDGKQADLAILGFVEDMKTIKNSDGSTPAWFDLKHTCESVDFAEGNTYKYDGKDVVDTFTLACQKPGCDHHKIENLGFKFGASIRTAEPYGLRFGFRFNSDLVVGEGENINVGILIVPADLIDGELTVDTTIAKNVKAEKSFTSGENYYDGAYSFAGVLTNIPQGAFTRPITARAYIEIDGKIYYTETATTNYQAVADYFGVTIAE